MDEQINNNNNGNNNSTVKPSCTIFCAKVKSFNTGLSPAYLNSQRALIVSKTRAFVASSNRIIQLDVVFPTNYEKNFTKIEGIPTPITIDGSQLTEKEITTQLKSEIQSLAASFNYSECTANSNNPKIYERVGVIDSKGAFEIFENQQQDDGLKSLYSVAANSYGSKTESGWSGLTFHPLDIETVAVARYFQRQVHIFKRDKLVASIQLANSPTQVLFVYHAFSRQVMLAVTEANQLNIYDPSSKPAFALAQKFQPTADVLYTMTSDSQNLVVGGASRSVHVYDTRRWTNMGSWSGCLKYEITSAHFSSKHDRAIYLGGLDSEILAGDWNGMGSTDHFSGLRVDSRWLGISKLYAEETLFGMTSSGSVYWVHDTDSLYTPPPPKSKKHSLQDSNTTKQTKKEKKQQKQQQQQDTKKTKLDDQVDAEVSK